MFCNKCGKEIPVNSVFCPSCGNKLLTAEENNSEKSDTNKADKNIPVIDLKNNNQKAKNNKKLVLSVITFVWVIVMGGYITLNVNKWNEGSSTQVSDKTNNNATSFGGYESIQSLETEKMDAGSDEAYKEDEASDFSTNVDMMNEQLEKDADGNGAQTALNDDYTRYSGYYYTDDYGVNISLSFNPMNTVGSVGTARITIQYDNDIQSHEYSIYLDDTSAWKDVVENTEYIFRYVDEYNDNRYLIASIYEGNMILQEASEYKISYWLEKE